MYYTSNSSVADPHWDGLAGKLSVINAEFRRPTVIQVKRAYEQPRREDGARFLVERLWPRGVRKEDLQVESWVKDVAPTSQLRQWFQHDPAKWDEFRRRYFRELEQRPAAWHPLVARARLGRITLVYSAHDAEHNNALALKEFLEANMNGKGRSRRAA